MPTKMSQFHKVSYEQFRKDWLDTFYADKQDYIDPVTKEVDIQINAAIRETYDGIQLPTRSTMMSAGYDFHMPMGFTLKAGKSIKIPTGIRCEMYDGWVLTIHPRSSLGFKYGLHMANTTGIVDGDYYESDNEGHIFCELVNDSSLAKNIPFNKGDKFCQGIFVPFGITLDDDVTEKRTGGMGSTGR